MANRVKKITEKYAEIAKSPDFAFGEVQSIIAEIHSLPPNERKVLIPLYKKIGQDLLDKEISVANYDLTTFIKRCKKTVKFKKIEGADDQKYEDIFKDRLRTLAGCLKGAVNNLRRYTFLRLSNPIRPTKVVLLHDSHSCNQIFRKIKTCFDELDQECDILDLDKFEQKVKERDYIDFNFIVFLIVSPGVDSAEHAIKFIEELNTRFEVVQLKILNYDNPIEEIDFETNISEIKKEISYLAKIDLSNKELSPEKEKILKKMFADLIPYTIEYEKISGGFSGAEVFKVKPFKIGEPTKYIIKLDMISKGKLSREGVNFKEYVQGHGWGYEIKEEITETYRAIRYYFAARDGMLESESFAKKIDDKRQGFNKKTSNQLSVMIESLFEERIFRDWYEDRRTIVKLDIEKAYSNYVNLAEIIEQISLMLNQTQDEIRNSELIKNFKKIISCKNGPRCYFKICHGDLHSQNFFIDEGGKTFLIDFGDTAEHHALIDHTTLEASIKFRHIPSYISIEELCSIERELLKDDSFNEDYNFESTTRSNLIGYLSLVTMIRKLSQNYMRDSAAKMEYYISLFIIAFRQIRYESLNQLYALKSAELLAEMIVKKLGL